MKCTFLSILLASLSIANAQQPQAVGPGGHSQRPPGGDRMNRSFFPPELVMRNQKAINLTPDQQSAIRSEMSQTTSRFNDLQWQLSAEEEALDSLVRGDVQDEKQILAQFDKLLLVEAELKRTQLSMLVRLKALLTPEQQQKLGELKKQGPSGDSERRPPPRGEEP